MDQVHVDEIDFPTPGRLIRFDALGRRNGITHITIPHKERNLTQFLSEMTGRRLLAELLD